MFFSWYNQVTFKVEKQLHLSDKNNNDMKCFLAFLILISINIKGQDNAIKFIACQKKVKVLLQS